MQLDAIAMSCFETLKSQHLKLTPQRRMIIDILHGRERHITAEEIINRVQARMPGVNKSTIYRTLDLLENAGCVYKSEISDQFVYYHAEDGHHYHLVCQRCGKTVDCDKDLFKTIQKKVYDQYQFNIDFNHMIMKGLCTQCKDRTN